MNDKTDYKLANLKNKELKHRAMRREILACESEQALEMILDAPSPATLIQSFPDQDLYYLMHKIGSYDFIPVLSLATSKQWEYIMDVEVWDNDRIDLEYMTKSLDLLFQADPQRLLRWIMKEKPDLLEFYLFKNIEIKIREHDEPPPDDFDNYISLDDKFYFRFPEKSQLIEDDDEKESENNEDAWELIEKMLKAVAEMDLSVFHGILLETGAVLPAETEEEQFRLKNLRLAEKGFAPPHEAIGIYQPTKLSNLRKRPDNNLFKSSFDPEIPMPPQFFSKLMKGDNLFVRSLEFFDPEFMLRLESELAALINKVICADRIKLKSRDDMEKAVIKTCDYLNLGLEVILKNELKPELAGDAVQNYFLEDIFRTGSRAGIMLKTKAVNWFKQSFMNHSNLPLSFLGEEYLGCLGGLFLDRPLYYDNYTSCKDLYRNFNSLSDIKKSFQTLEQIIAIDEILGKLNVEISSFKEGVLNYKTLILTLWAKGRIGLPRDLEPIDVELFKKFFAAFFSQPCLNDETRQIPLNDFILWICEAADIKETDLPEKFYEIMTDLIRELEDEYGSVNPANIDPRFIPHFFLSRKKKK